MPQSSRMKSVYLDVRTRMSLPRRNRPDFKQQFERDFALIHHPVWSAKSDLLIGDLPRQEGFERFGIALRSYRTELVKSALSRCRLSAMQVTHLRWALRAALTPAHQETMCLTLI